jgi:hypothetical protein
MDAALVEGQLSRQTVPIIGPERMTLEQAVRRVAKVVGKTPIIFPMPIAFHYAFARVLEAIMVVPLVSTAQVRILTEGFDQPHDCEDALPQELIPRIPFSEEQIRKGLPAPGPFALTDLKCSHA